MHELNWVEELTNLFSLSSQTRLHLIGMGNPFRKDDGLGVQVIRKLRQKCRNAPAYVKIHPPSTTIEYLISEIDYTRDKALIFDAIEFNSFPGSIIFSTLDDSRFGFFGTHNIPIRSLPNVSSNLNRVLLLGIQPGYLEVGEGLSNRVRKSVEDVVSVIIGILRK